MALIYIGINLSIIGVVPWREFVPAAEHPQSDFIVSIFMERIYGSRCRDAVHRAGAVDRVRLGVRAAARLFAHPLRRGASTARSSGSFAPAAPDQADSRTCRCWSIGVIAIACSALSLGMVIDALITTRILMQFIGQIVALALLRRRAPDMPRPFRVWLYPMPNLIALFGWIFLFATSGIDAILYGLATLGAGNPRLSRLVQARRDVAVCPGSTLKIARLHG